MNNNTNLVCQSIIFYLLDWTKDLNSFYRDDVYHNFLFWEVVRNAGDDKLEFYCVLNNGYYLHFKIVKYILNELFKLEYPIHHLKW